MRVLFVDSLYWVALINPKDQWHQKARAAEAEVEGARRVTTEAVLVEVLNFFASFKPEMRQAAAGIVHDLIDDPDVEIVTHSHRMFLDGVTLFEARADKTYSMVDWSVEEGVRRFVEWYRAYYAVGPRQSAARVAT